MKPFKNLRSPARNARGLGSAHHGVKHWWLQRLTALAMIPLFVWFIFALMRATLFQEPEALADWLSSPFSAVGLSLLFIAMFTHAALGIQVVVEDYVKCPVMKYSALVGTKFACFALGAIAVLSIIRLHMLDVVGGVL